MLNFLLHQKIISKSNIIFFECGINSRLINRPPISSQFYLLAIVFIIFDLEIIFLMNFFYRINLISHFFILIIFIIFVVLILQME